MPYKFFTHFQAVLKSDRNNYTGLVLFGVALQNTEQKDQAPKAFWKAIEVSPKQLLAWQGLASYYEKETSDNESDQKELLPVYRQLISLERYVC
jgi:superkiller protein 3